MNILNIFHWSYWFSAPLPAVGWVKAVFILLPIILLIVGIVLEVVKKTTQDTLKKKVYGRFGPSVLFLAITLGFWVLFRQEQIPIFAVRFWPLSLFVIFGWWMGCIVRYVTKRVPEIQKQNAERMEKEKYLPKSK